MKYCTKCGNELKSKDLYCSKCGTKVEKEIKEAEEVKNTNSEEIDSNFTINKRDIATQIILTVITCGLYLIYWNYDIGRKLYGLGKKYDKEIADNSIIYLILSIIQANLVNLILMQSYLNKLGK